MMKELTGKNAILTGASRGLGLVIGRKLAQEGVNLALAARSEKQLKEAAEELSALNVRAVPVPTDVTDEKSLNKLYKKAAKELGPIDILVNNAGIELVYSYTKLSLEYIETIVKTNLLSAMKMTRIVLPDMIKQGTGHIVTMASLGGKKGSPYSAPYAATKAGLIEFTSSIRAELEGTGVSASVICPGFVSETGMFAVYNKKAPWIAGETTPEKVAKAVIRAIRKNKQEIIVSPGAITLMMLLDAITPTIMCRLLKIGGVYDFYRKQAEENENEFKMS